MSQKTDVFYNKFSLFYPLVDLVLKPQKKTLFNVINSLQEGQLLEIGAGNGSHFKYYHKHQVTAIDTSDAMLAIARKHRTERIQVLKMSGEDLLFAAATFDYVVLSHVIAVVPHPEQLLTEILRVLKPGGQLFILNHFTPKNCLKYVDHLFAVISKAFHFRSVFYIDQLEPIKKYLLVKEIHFGPGAYFKLLIYKKP
jgi:Methylase involved in ubiquinone/menaquinone biosynthesis